MANNIPSDLKYSQEHEWAKCEGNVITIGITDFAQSSLGDIVFVELPEVGTELSKGSTFGVVESIKSVSDLYAPVTGKVVERNEEVENSPELINENSYNAWLLKIEISDNSEFQQMLDASAYSELCNEN